MVGCFMQLQNMPYMSFSPNKSASLPQSRHGSWVFINSLISMSVVGLAVSWDILRMQEKGGWKGYVCRRQRGTLVPLPCMALEEKVRGLIHPVRQWNQSYESGNHSLRVPCLGQTHSRWRQLRRAQWGWTEVRGVPHQCPAAWRL